MRINIYTKSAYTSCILKIPVKGMCVLNNTQKEFIEGVGSKDGEKYSRQKRKKELLFAEGFQKHSFLNPLLLRLMIKLLRILVTKRQVPRPFEIFFLSVSLPTEVLLL